MLRIFGWFTLLGSPVILVWFMTALICLSTFPWLGWFGRRLLVFGRATTVITLLVLSALTGMVGGLLENPQMSEMSTGIRVLVRGLYSASMTPALLWIFLRTRSAVLPALAQASYASALGGAAPPVAQSTW